MANDRVVIICQARTGSSRLPRKVLLPLAGAPLLVRFMERVLRSRSAHAVVVATTTKPSDDVLVDLCVQHGYHVFRGHDTDLLDRHYQCAREFNADVVVKVPSDCPLIDPAIIDRVIDTYVRERPNVDFVSNLHPASYPDGNDVEVMSFPLLETAWKRAHRPHEREHTTPWMWDNNPLVQCMNVVWETGLDYSMIHRWTIDYAEDYMLIKAVYEHLYERHPSFTTGEILDLIEHHPEIAAMNAHLAGVNWYHNHLHELSSITSTQTRTYPPTTP